MTTHIARVAAPAWAVRVTPPGGEVLVGPFRTRDTAEWIAETMRGTAADAGLPAEAVTLTELIPPIDLPAARAAVRAQARP